MGSKSQSSSYRAVLTGQTRAGLPPLTYNMDTNHTHARHYIEQAHTLAL